MDIATLIALMEHVGYKPTCAEPYYGGHIVHLESRQYTSDKALDKRLAKIGLYCTQLGKDQRGHYIVVKPKTPPK